MEMPNVGIYSIDVGCCECVKENSRLEFFARESAEPKALTLVQVLSNNNAANFSLFTVLPRRTHEWKQKLEFSYIHRLPHFVFLVTLAEIMLYYVADDRLKRTLIYDSENKEQIWRYITYMFVHTDPVHLSLNLIIQGLLGVPLELEQGCIRCAAVYFCGGLTGSLGAFVFADVPLMAGASGGVYALLLSHIPHTILNYEVIKHGGYRVVAVVALTAADIIYVLCHIHFGNNERPRIGWVAHASGAAGGIFLGFLIFEGTSNRRRKLQTISWILLLIVCVLGVTRIIYFDYFIGS